MIYHVSFKLPITIIIFNNGGYCSIKNTQKNYFNKRYLGIDNNSNLDSDALNALRNLGFRSPDITKALNKIDKDCSLEEKIKLALKELR